MRGEWCGGQADAGTGREAVSRGAWNARRAAARRDAGTARGLPVGGLIGGRQRLVACPGGSGSAGRQQG